MKTNMLVPLFLGCCVMGALGMRMLERRWAWWSVGLDRGIAPFRVTMTVGCFDLTHRGHLVLFRRMGAFGQRQVVLIHDDASYELLKGARPAMDEAERVRQAQAALPTATVRLVHSPDPSSAIRRVLSDVAREGVAGEDVAFMRGNDLWTFPGYEVCRDAGVCVMLLQRFPGVSTTMLKTAAAALEQKGE